MENLRESSAAIPSAHAIETRSAKRTRQGSEVATSETPKKRTYTKVLDTETQRELKKYISKL